MEREQRLQRAFEHIFSLGLDDSGARIAIQTMAYGLAQLHCLQEHLGYAPNAFFLGAPDLTVTRNVYRFTHGIGYGGIIFWGDGTAEWIPLDLKPNACGMLVGGLTESREYADIIDKLEALKREPVAIEGTQMKWDFNASNHFINLFQVADNPDLPPYIFVIHGAGDEFRGDNHGQFGLYIDKSSLLQKRASTFVTPFGKIHYLTGQDAWEYLYFYEAVEEFTRQRRGYVAEQLFGDYTRITDQNHQGLAGLNTIILGCHTFSDEETLYPLMLRPDRPGYLLSGCFNLSEEQIEMAGFTRRAKRLGIYEQLRKVNLLPHGGGYIFPEILDVDRVWETDGRRYYELTTLTGLGRQLVEHLREIPYEYRGQQVLTQTLHWGLGRKRATLIPLFTLKI